MLHPNCLLYSVYYHLLLLHSRKLACMELMQFSLLLKYVNKYEESYMSSKQFQLGENILISGCRDGFGGVALVILSPLLPLKCVVMCTMLYKGIIILLTDLLY